VPSRISARTGMSARSGPIAIVTAFREEFGAVLSRSRDARFLGAFVEARIGTATVVLCMTGDGARNAGSTAASLCERVHPAALLGAGVAGALSPDLAVGDLVVSRRVRDSEGEAPPPDADLLEKALETTRVTAGTLLTLERPEVLASRKIALGISLDSGGPAAADMESAAWARAASSHRVPYLVVRAITDSAAEDLPEYLTRCVGRDGGIHRPSVVLRALANPGTIPALLDLRRRVRACSEGLADFLEQLLSAAPPS
jgi:adenosylhomocysteine nucleosidase